MRVIVTVLALSLCLVAPTAHAQSRVVTTTPTLADIVRQIGGEHVEVESIMRGPENPHNVIPKPSFMMKLRRADLFVHMGLDAEPWVPQLIKGARQRRLHPGNDGNVDASRGIGLLEVPQRGGLTRALGDIHVFGNPHYLLDPLNGIGVARTIADALKRHDPRHGDAFEMNYDAFSRRIRELTERLVDQIAPYEGTRVVVYHRTWPYFLARFGLVEAAEIEPKPGIAPGPGHLSRVVDLMQDQGVKVVIVGTFSSLSNAETVAGRAEGTALQLPTEVNAIREASSYETLFEHNVRQLVEAFERMGIKPAAAAPTDLESRPAEGNKG